MEPTRYEDFKFAFHQYRKKHGKAAATQLLKSITGESDPEAVHEGLYEPFVIASRGETIRPAVDAKSSAKWKKIQAAVDATSSAEWKKIQEAAKSAKGHINVNNGLKRAT